LPIHVVVAATVTAASCRPRHCRPGRVADQKNRPGTGRQRPVIVMPSPSSTSRRRRGAGPLHQQRSVLHRAKRVLGAESITTPCGRLRRRYGSPRVATPCAKDTQIGPLGHRAQSVISTRSAGRCPCRRARAHRRQARPGAGNYYPPTVLADVPPPRTSAARTVRPGCAPVPRHAISTTQSHWQRHALWLGRVGVDPQPGRAASPGRGIRCGAVLHHEVVASDPRLPFGASSARATGELSAAGMREFLNAKTVVVAEP